MPNTRDQILKNYAIKAYTKYGVPLSVAKQATELPRNEQHKFIMDYAKEHDLNSDALDLVVTNDEQHSLEALPKELLIKALDSVDSIGIWIIDDEKKYIYCNDALEKISGCPKEFILGLQSDNTKIIHCDKSDIPMDDKKQISFFQDVNNYISGNYYRQITTISKFEVGDENKEYQLCFLERVPDLEKRLIEADSYNVRSESWASGNQSELVYKSAEMNEVRQLAKSAAKGNVPVLITGESGVGKEVLVQYMRNENTAQPELIDINCAAIPENLLEAELFGYEKGAFTGARATGKKGLIEKANGGILFLDEINSMPLSIQGKLLRVLETKQIRRLGGTERINVDFKLICATNSNLEDLIAQGSFRADLYYRINVISIFIPPLKDRREDILPLARVFLARFCKSYNVNKILSEKSEEILCKYNWPGNVRELRNVIERAVVLSPANEIEIKPENIFLKVNNPSTDTISIGIDMSDDDFSLQKSIENLEKQILIRAFNNGNDTRTIASQLKVNQSTIVRKMQKYNIHK